MSRRLGDNPVFQRTNQHDTNPSRRRRKDTDRTLKMGKSAQRSETIEAAEI
jgi:hypothetical protein